MLNKYPSLVIYYSKLAATRRTFSELIYFVIHLDHQHRSVLQTENLYQEIGYVFVLTWSNWSLLLIVLEYLISPG